MPSWRSLWRCPVEAVGRRRNLLLLLKGAAPARHRPRKMMITREVCVNWDWENSPTPPSVCVCVNEQISVSSLCAVESFLRNSVPVCPACRSVQISVRLLIRHTENPTHTGCGHQFSIVNTEEVHFFVTSCTKCNRVLKWWCVFVVPVTQVYLTKTQ